MYLSNLSDQACQPVLHVNPENLAGCKSAFLSSNSNPCPWYYNTSSAIRAKTCLLGPEGLKGSWILSSKEGNQTDRLLFRLLHKLHFPKKFCKSKMYRNCREKITSIGSAVRATALFQG